MMKLDKDGNYIPWQQPQYGFDANDEVVQPEAGYTIIPKGDKLLSGDKPFDVYAGWMDSDGYDVRNGHHAFSEGRWICWERKTS